MHRHDHMPPCLVMLLSSKLVKKKEHFGKGRISTMTPNTTNFNNKNTNLGNRCLHLQQSLHPCLATKTLPSPKIWQQAGSQIPLMPFLHASQSGHQIKHKPFCLLFLQIIRIFSVTNQSKHIKTKAPKGLAPQAGLKLLLQCCC